MFKRLHSWPLGDVWRCDLAAMPADDPAGWAVLSLTEQTRARRFAFEHHRRRFVAAHVALRHLLADTLGERPEALVFDTGPHGKPFLPAAPRLHFNLSHSEDSALAVLSSRCEVGVDIERHRDLRDAHGLVERHFSKDEQAAWMALPVGERQSAFHEAWARKEACVKATGWGLSLPLETVNVGWTVSASVPSPSASPSSSLPLSLPDGGHAGLGVFSLHLAPGWAGAVAWVHAHPVEPMSPSLP